MKRSWKQLAGPLVAVGLTLAFLSVTATQAPAADLGGNCCADLEERIAELESTAAHKGNRKMSLTIDGEISGSYQLLSIDGNNNQKIISDGNNPTYVGFSGRTLVNPDVAIGFRVEIDMRQLGLLGAPIESTTVNTRQAYWWVSHKGLGSFSLGKQAVATQDLDKWSTNSAYIAGKPLSFGSLSDAYLTGFDLPFDGDYRNAARWNSSDWNGFTVSASWSPSVKNGSFGDQGNAWDAAVRYRGDITKEFNVTGSAGYRHDTDLQVNLLGLAALTIPTGDVSTFLVNGSVLHVPTGVFLNANYAHQDYQDAGFKLQGLEVQAGLEERWTALGKTDVFGLWGRDQISFGSSADLNYFGLGAVQGIDAAAMKVYIGWKHYQEGDILPTDVDVVTAGAVVAF